MYFKYGHIRIVPNKVIIKNLVVKKFGRAQMHALCDKRASSGLFNKIVVTQIRNKSVKP